MVSYLTLAHAGEHVSENLWLAWTLDPSLLIPLALLLGGYLYALGPLRRRWNVQEPINGGKVAWFISGWVLLVVALVSPIDTLGDEYLFAAHMIQHMLIAVVIPPMLLLGVSGWMVDPLFKRENVRRIARWIGNPILAFGLFQLDVWVWHAPYLYDLTLENEVIHILEHLTFFVFGIMYWLPVLSPTFAIPRISRGFAILYLFMGCQPMVALGALITFAAQPLYLPYVAAPRVWGLSPLADQQLGGLIMWLPTNIPYLIALSVVFFQWVAERDLAERQAAGEFASSETLETLTPEGPALAIEQVDDAGGAAAGNIR